MIRVASFNVKNLNMGKDEESMKNRDYDEIARLMRGYDIVVMQEVLSQRLIEGFMGNSESAYLTKRFGRNWRGKWVDPQTSSKYYPYIGNDKRGEGYAFLWNTKTVELIKDDDGKDILPHRYSQYRPGEGHIRLMRDPGYGRFKIKNRKVEIRVITTHIIFGKPKQENFNPDIDVDYSDIGGAIKIRKNEFEILAGKIYKNIDEYRKEQNSNAVYTIIMGDYNLNIKGHGTSPATITDVCSFDPLGNLMITVQSEPTTINQNCDGFANNYDHCTYNFRQRHVIGNCYRSTALNDKKPEDIKEYRDTVSDHLPIVVDINLGGTA